MGAAGRAIQGRRGLDGARTLDAVFAVDRAAPMVTVLDGHPHTLAFLTGINQVPGVHLGVTRFGRSGDLDSVYRYHTTLMRIPSPGPPSILSTDPGRGVRAGAGQGLPTPGASAVPPPSCGPSAVNAICSLWSRCSSTARAAASGSRRRNTRMSSSWARWRR